MMDGVLNLPTYTYIIIQITFKLQTVPTPGVPWYPGH